METLKRSLIFFFAAGMYFYHLGAWTYRMDGFGLAELASYPEDVLRTTYAYMAVILAFLIAGVLSAVNGQQSIKALLVFLCVPALYEAYRIVSTVLAYGVAEPDLFYPHLGVHLSLGVVVAYCIYHGLQLRNCFNKNRQLTRNALNCCKR